MAPATKTPRTAHPLAAATVTANSPEAKARREQRAIDAEAAIARRIGPPPADVDPDCRTCRTCPRLRNWREGRLRARWVARDCWCDARHDLPVSLDMGHICADHPDLVARGKTVLVRPSAG